jgi:hypothetical protein
MRTLDPANLQGIREEIDLYDHIRDRISGLTSTLKDMNTLMPDMHLDSDFHELYKAIETRLKAIPAAPAGSTQAEAAGTSSPAANVSASNNGVSVGNIQIGGGVSGNIIIGNNNQSSNNT